MAGGGESVIQVRDLVVDYKVGRKRHRAVHGISFDVQRGECIGFIGANGAGKSSTIKTLLGFIFPTSGTAHVFGKPAGSVESRERLGYLPEVALYYPFMKARELLELYGGLHGLDRAYTKRRIPDLLQEVGLGDKGETLLRHFSKGMQQRLGIAQAIISEPELMIFDELSSGLDPVGRFDLRQVLLRLKREGRTIFFSSHELSEVESLCDRVIMINQGHIVTEAAVGDLLKPLNEYEIVYRLPAGQPQPEGVGHYQPTLESGEYRLVLQNVDDYASTIAQLAHGRAEIVRTSSRAVSLEEYFINLIRDSKAANAGAARP